METASKSTVGSKSIFLLLTVAALFWGTPAHACECGPNWSAPQLYVIRVTAVEPLSERDERSKGRAGAANFSFEVVRIMRGTTPTARQLTYFVTRADCGPPLNVDTYYLIARSDDAEPTVGSCSLQYIPARALERTIAQVRKHIDEKSAR